MLLTSEQLHLARAMNTKIEEELFADVCWYGLVKLGGYPRVFVTQQ